jgi:hypothetical protein
MFLYKPSARAIQLGSSSPILTNSFLIIPPSQTSEDAINCADTIIIIHKTPKITNLIHHFMSSSLSDVIILYPQKKATAIHTTINI